MLIDPGRFVFHYAFCYYDNNSITVPGGLEVRIWHFHLHGLGSNPTHGNVLGLVIRNSFIISLLIKRFH